MGADVVEACIREIGFGFMFAPLHHPAFKNIVPVRRELGVRTIFNFLGPLTNPAGARHQVIGVSDPGKLETMAARSGRAGGRESPGSVERGWPGRVLGLGCDAGGGAERRRALHVRRDARAGRPGAGGDGAVGAGTPEQNALVLREVLAGNPGTERSLAVLNAGAAIYVAGGAETLEEGVRAAERPSIRARPRPCSSAGWRPPA